MLKEIKSFLTYEEFEVAFRRLIDLAHKEHLLYKVFECDSTYSAADAYTDLLVLFFTEDQTEYDGNFYRYWNHWEEMTGSVITSFVYGVLDENGALVAPDNHELRLLNEETFPLDSLEKVWQICTGEIAVKEKFS